MNLRYGSSKYIVILRSAVGGVILIPRRDIHSKFNPLFLTSTRQLFENISIAVFPPALTNSMCAVCTRPKAETVMMFCGNNNTLHSGQTGCLSPLLTVKMCGCKDFRVFFAVSPFHIGKCIGSEMSKHIILHFLPFKLSRRRSRTIRLWSILLFAGR